MLLFAYSILADVLVTQPLYLVTIKKPTINLLWNIEHLSCQIRYRKSLEALAL